MNTLAKTVLTAAVVVASLSGVQAFAHHSGAMFDSEKEVILTGVVTKFDFLNPHSWLYIETTAEDGKVVPWGFELDAPPLLQRAGIGPKHWVPGDLITVKTNPLRDGRSAGSFVGSVNSDGVETWNVEGLVVPVAK